MNKDAYQKLVQKYTPKESKGKNMLIAFFVGGLIGFLGEVFIHILMTSFGIARTDATVWLCITIIFIACLLTALGFFDKWVSKAKAGLIVPTTGFAHSVASSALDYKKDGMITGLGSNFFKLAGSVILYGIIGAFFLVVLKVMFYG